MENLKGPFKDIIPMFIKYKKSIGYKYNNINNYKILDNILVEKNIISLDNTKLIFDSLITNEKNEKAKERNYKALKNLYEFMYNLGFENLYFEPIYFEKSKDFVGKILTKKEIEKLFKKIDKESNLLTTKDKFIYPVLFRLVYSCGLRINEALNLKKSDLNFINKTITIYRSKNDITRLIPLSNTMFEVIKQYLKIVDTRNNNYLFELNSRKINYNKVKNFFDSIVLETNLIPLRIHDLRHLHAITNLNKHCSKNISVYDILYPLSIYLGHDKIESTEYYLQLTKENYNKIVKTLNKQYPDLFPKVGDIDE